MEESAARSLVVSARGAPPPFRSFDGFVAALREADRTALRMAYIWYMPLLRDQARKLGVAADECDELSATVLGDVLLHLQRTHVPPRDFVRYLVGALRNRARNAHRDRRRVAQTQEHAYSDVGAARERIVAECHSEYGLRSSSGVDELPLRSAIQKLAVKSAQMLTDIELALMVGLSHHVPLRELAEQAGISYGAARVRVHRLRERFHKLALQHVASLHGEERAELERFFRRAGITGRTDGSSPRDVANREVPHDTE
jgi:DNA-directed RNA polymerase specialized sigma24 family protein